MDRRRIEEARFVKSEPGSDEVQDWKSNFDRVYRAIGDFKMEDDANSKYNREVISCSYFSRNELTPYSCSGQL